MYNMGLLALLYRPQVLQRARNILGQDTRYAYMREVRDATAKITLLYENLLNRGLLRHLIKIAISSLVPIPIIYLM